MAAYPYCIVAVSERVYPRGALDENFGLSPTLPLLVLALDSGK